MRIQFPLGQGTTTRIVELPWLPLPQIYASATSCSMAADFLSKPRSLTWAMVKAQADSWGRSSMLKAGCLHSFADTCRSLWSSPVWHVEGFYYQESQSVPEGWEIHFITPCSSSNRTKSTVDFPTSFTVHKETKLLPFYNKKEGVSTVGSNKNWPCGLAHVFFFFFFYFVMGQVGLVVLQDLWKFNVLFNCNEI